MLRFRPFILCVMSELELSATIYRAPKGTGSDLQSRERCINALVSDAAQDFRTHIILERDATLVARDTQWLFRAVRAAGATERLYYRHASPTAEPLLSVPDIIAWAWGYRQKCVS